MAPQAPPDPATVPEDRLNSWKEIAAYLKRGVSTAQRWARTEGLPVRRLPHSKAGTVFAYRAEIDAWWRERSARLEAEDAAPALSEASQSHARRTWLVLTIFLILVVGGIAYWASRPEPGTASLAVLPFVNASGEADADYLGDGITEQLINNLARTPNLRLTPRSHVFRYKGPNVDPQKVGRELGVRAVLTGRVRKRDGVLNLQVDLIDVDRGSQVWGRQYTQEFNEILSIQNTIAREVVERLGVRASQDPGALSRRSTENTDAYEAYLKGRYYWNRRTEESLKRAVASFRQALDLDPGYALAAAALADCYALYAVYQLESPRESGPKAKAAATAALQLDSSMAEPHAALGFVKSHYEWDWADAEREFQRSIELDPNYANGHFWYAVHLSATGRTDLAVAALQRAQQLDPLSLVIRAGVGGEPGLYAARRYDEAIAQVQTALDLDPGFAVGRLWLALSYEQKGMYPQAIAELERAAELSNRGPLVLGPLGHAYAASGNDVKAHAVLAELEAMSTRRYVSPFDRALIHLGLGDAHRTFAWLEKAIEDRSYRMHWLKVNPRFDRLRGDARFTSILRRMGLEP
jgi:TolB-like protein/Flp pilus assembly protein TadD